MRCKTVSSCRAQYPGLLKAFYTLLPCPIKHHLNFSGKHPATLQLMRECCSSKYPPQSGTHWYSWVNWSNVGWTNLAQGLTPQDSKPVSLSRNPKLYPWVTALQTRSINVTFIHIQTSPYMSRIAASWVHRITNTFQRDIRGNICAHSPVDRPQMWRLNHVSQSLPDCKNVSFVLSKSTRAFWLLTSVLSARTSCNVILDTWAFTLAQRRWFI